ncbi:unnamed protein product [Calypogeia fissa]
MGAECAIDRAGKRIDGERHENFNFFFLFSILYVCLTSRHSWGIQVDHMNVKYVAIGKDLTQTTFSSFDSTQPQTELVLLNIRLQTSSMLPA